MDSLAFGALIAVLIRGRHAVRVPKIANWSLLTAGILLAGRFSLGLARWITHRGTTAAAVSRLSELWDSTLIFTVVAAFFAALLVKAISPGPTGVGRATAALFGSRPLRTAGKYSYGWYVFHFPIWTWSLGLAISMPQFYGFRQSVAFAPVLIASNFVVSFAAAYTSYHLYEKHFLKLKKYFPERAAESSENAGARNP
jgi:peptidoglycan/LPS O-acetylase OafA/YrhL